MNENLNIEISCRQDTAVVLFKSAMVTDADGITAASKQIYDYIEKNNPKRMVVDFEQVKFFSSQILGLLVNIKRKLEAGGGDLSISAINPQLYRVFRITNLDKIFKFFPDMESAVKSAAGGPIK
jgi:anti-sigma B factor antagonist